MKNDYFCPAPWISISTDCNGSIRPCCRYSQPEKQVMYTMPWMRDGNIHELYNGLEMKKLRQAFLDGKKPYECQWCWTEEDAGTVSFRQKYLEREYKFDMDNPTPQIIDLKLSNVCNLKCRMCVPTASSLIAKEQGVHDDYWTSMKILGTEQEKTFFEDWLPNMKEIELTGGEPFFSPENKKLIEKIVDSGHAEHIKILITTNGMFYIPKLMEKMKSFSHVTISLSVDDIGPRLEYARGNSNWNTIKNNISEMLTNYPDFSINIYRTVNNFNIYHLDELEAYAMNRDINIVNGLLHEPHYLCIKNLSPFIKEEIANRYKSSNLNKYDDILNFMNTTGKDTSYQFYEETQKLDIKRNQQFEKSFPEWSEVLMF